MQANKQKESLLRKPGVQTLLASLICIVLGLLVGYIALLIINPAGATEAIIGVIKNFWAYSKPEKQLKNFGVTLVTTAPLLMCSLSVLFAYKTGLFNIGAAGQYVAGAGACLYCALALHLQELSLGEVGESTISDQLVDSGHFLHGLADGGEVGEHATGPALDDVWHIDAGCLLGNHFLSLFLSTYEEDFLTLTSNVLQSLCSIVNLQHGLVQVDDVDTVTLGIDVGSHGGVPLALQVAEMAASLQQLIKICS